MKRCASFLLTALAVSILSLVTAALCTGIETDQPARMTPRLGTPKTLR